MNAIFTIDFTTKMYNVCFMMIYDLILSDIKMYFIERLIIIKSIERGMIVQILYFI